MKLISFPLLSLILVSLASATFFPFVNTNTNGVRFFYYPNPRDSREIVPGDWNSLLNSGLNRNTPTVLIIDGFLSNLNSQMSQTMKNAFIAEHRAQVIVVDWGALSGSGANFGSNSFELFMPYLRTLGNIDYVANQVADFLNFLRAYGGIDFNRVYLCSHSLGAVIAGRTGRVVQRKYHGIISRITGLDPAGPFFNLPISRKLDKSSASFVDIYHTSFGALGDSQRGTGHINVFINGGSNQPGCKREGNGGGLGGYCSHSYSWKLFNSSFNRRLFACPCSGTRCVCQSCFNAACKNPVSVGTFVTQNIRGDFYVATSDVFS